MDLNDEGEQHTDRKENANEEPEGRKKKRKKQKKQNEAPPQCVRRAGKRKTRTEIKSRRVKKMGRERRIRTT